MRTERAAALAAALLILGGLTACSTVGGQSSRSPGTGAAVKGPQKRTPQEALQLAAQVTDKAGSARLEVDEQNHEYGHSTVTGAAAWGEDRSSAGLAITQDRGKGEVRVVDGSYYASYDWLPAEFKGRHWAKASRELAEALDSGDTSTGGPKSLTGVWLTSLTEGPSGPLRLMAKVGQLTLVGKEPVASAAATHYRATASVTDYSAADTGMSDADRAATLAYYQGQGAQTITFDFWINDANELVKSVETVQGTAGTDTVTTSLSQLGLSVPVQIPPAADTVDLAKQPVTR
ncbi:lipoprotein [Kitasatospora atroaurantiaca]|uniref:Lipoprotein n=1 Tax=Kitasatospora atroaurantiaca TaxID=285545 RepID=A0A561EQI8_9ACTN|nr:hypothetical protein [Kitasatospora atroaurantiaca]TWE17878.1 hypothetical protein FB465_2916 [Kitasatospora atroaurantiaca]